MSLEKDGSELSVMEAVDILSNMAEVDLKAPIDIEQEELRVEINWRDPKQALKNEPIIRETFRILHKYLQNMVRNNRNILKDAEKMRGVQALMLLATEAAQKMDQFAGLYPKKYKAISELKEYTDLQKYYRQQILKQMPMPPEEGEDWEEDLASFSSIKAEKRGHQDLEAVRKDQNYELFFIKNENDKPYFTRSLLRHIRLVGNFDELVTKAEGEDPLLHILELLDRELHQGAKEILVLCAVYLDDFYQQGMKIKQKPFVGSLNKAVMALRMAANPKNLIENQSFKSCLEYYGDFHRFLRDAMTAPGYQKVISGELPEDAFSHSLVLLTHALCCYFFMRIEPEKEAVKLIGKIVKRGEEMRGPRPKEKRNIWETILDEDESLRHLLKYFPNGPILRILDSFREDEEFEGWDPLLHGNFPSQMFNFAQGDLHVSVLRLPCPVKQNYINSAEIAEEFFGLLRFYQHEMKKDKHLLVNLQDRTSWEEHTRCTTIEQASLRADYYDTLAVIGLPKNTSFFVQEEEYAHLGGAPVFMEQFKAQIMNGEDCGFFHMESIKNATLDSFVSTALALIHKEFFEEKTSLNRLERLSFIEIFYILYVLKIIDLKKIDSVSFTCKDAVDTGMMQTAEFYGMIRMFSSAEPFTQQEINHLKWILYSPALLIRERSMHRPRFKRAIMTLEMVDKSLKKNHKGIVKGLNKLYKNLKFPLEIKFD